MIYDVRLLWIAKRFYHVLLFSVNHEVEPQCIYHQQSSGNKKDVFDTKLRGDMTTNKGTKKHAKELGRLVKTIDAAKESSWSILPDEAVDGRQKTRGGNSEKKAKQTKLPWCLDKSLWNKSKTSEQKCTKKNLMRADVIGQMSKT